MVLAQLEIRLHLNHRIWQWLVKQHTYTLPTAQFIFIPFYSVYVLYHTLCVGVMHFIKTHYLFISFHLAYIRDCIYVIVMVLPFALVVWTSVDIALQIIDSVTISIPTAAFIWLNTSCRQKRDNSTKCASLDLQHRRPIIVH